MHTKAYAPDFQDIIDYENGDMDESRIPIFFQGMIDSGIVWDLQGHYGRTATDLINSGYCHLPITPKGTKKSCGRTSPLPLT
jgi:hypothetical protein